jgi:hypothetical protein
VYEVQEVIFQTMPTKRRPQRRTIGIVVAAAALAVVATVSRSDRARAADVLPTSFAFGMTNGDGAAGQLKNSGVNFTYRYQYLAGGTNTGKGWQTWSPNGDFAARYMKESGDNGLVPVFTYYQLLQSQPANGTKEDDKDFNNLNNTGTMRAYYTDFIALLDQANAFGRPVIVHVEPDLGGYMQQRVVDDSNSATMIPAVVASSGVGELAGIPNTYQGFNQALLKLRDRHARNVLLATHVSAWSTKIDVTTTTDPVDVGAIAQKTARFLNTAGLAGNPDGMSTYDLIFIDASDRDAGFHQIINGDGGAHWWDETNRKLPNFSTFDKYLKQLSASSGKRLVLWQVPIGNTIMRTQNNTWNHFQDNRAQYWLSGYPADGHLATLAQSGVVAILWGRGADGGTSASDAANDGVTNPPAIGNNTRVATSADDDGGYLIERLLAYQQAGPLKLNGYSPPASSPPTVQSTVQPTVKPTVAPPVPSSRPTTPPVATNRVTVQLTATKSGQQRITFRASASSKAVVHVEIDGGSFSGPIAIGAATKKRPSTRVQTKAIPIVKGPHTVTVVVDSGTVKIDSIALR